MSRRGLGEATLGGLTALLCLILLVQLGGRANRADDAASAIRRDGRGVIVLFDRGGAAGVFGEGWAKPILGQGVWSTAPTASLILPTSTAAGDADLCLVLAPVGDARGQPVAVRVGDVPVGVWTPWTEGDQRVCFRVPSGARVRSYELVVAFDLPAGPPSEVGGPPTASSIKIVSGSVQIRRS